MPTKMIFIRITCRRRLAIFFASFGTLICVNINCFLVAAELTAPPTIGRKVQTDIHSKVPTELNISAELTLLPTIVVMETMTEVMSELSTDVHSKVPTELNISAEFTLLPTLGQKLGVGNECSEDYDCESRSCVFFHKTNMRTCRCIPCSSSGCGGCSATESCKLPKGMTYPRCETYNQLKIVNIDLTTEKPTEETTEMPEIVVMETMTEVMSEVPTLVHSKAPTELNISAEFTLLPTLGQKLGVGSKCSEDDDCESGCVF